jgi:hypothetical protein
MRRGFSARAWFFQDNGVDIGQDIRLQPLFVFCYLPEPETRSLHLWPRTALGKRPFFWSLGEPIKRRRNLSIDQRGSYSRQSMCEALRPLDSPEDAARVVCYLAATDIVDWNVAGKCEQLLS